MLTTCQCRCNHSNPASQAQAQAHTNRTSHIPHPTSHIPHPTPHSAKTTSRPSRPSRVGTTGSESLLAAAATATKVVHVPGPHRTWTAAMRWGGVGGATSSSAAARIAIHVDSRRAAQRTTADHSGHSADGRWHWPKAGKAGKTGGTGETGEPGKLGAAVSKLLEHREQQSCAPASSNNADLRRPAVSSFSPMPGAGAGASRFNAVLEAASASGSLSSLACWSCLLCLVHPPAGGEARRPEVEEV